MIWPYTTIIMNAYAQNCPILTRKKPRQVLGLMTLQPKRIHMSKRLWEPYKWLQSSSKKGKNKRIKVISWRRLRAFNQPRQPSLCFPLMNNRDTGRNWWYIQSPKILKNMPLEQLLATPFPELRHVKLWMRMKL